MTSNQDTGIPAGWVGGFVESNPAFAYPNPDFSSLEMKRNMANIPLLQRQQAVKWPEFSWETKKGNADPKRCFQMFSPDISRLGYTDKGRVYSIICPQQGACVPKIGCLNVEVKVTGNRGWANETNRELAADMGVVGKIWLSPSAHQNELVKTLWDQFKKSEIPFPSDKKNAIVINTHLPGNPKEPIFPLRKGETTDFAIPEFAKHPEAWTVGHLGVEIGTIRTTGNDEADEFNKILMDLFNLAAGNMLECGNVLTWNVWFTHPELVDQEEWRNHAELWRASIDADYGSPTSPGTKPRYFDGTPFSPLTSIEDGLDTVIEDEVDKVYKDGLDKIDAFLKKLI